MCCDLLGQSRKTYHWHARWWRWWFRLHNKQHQVQDAHTTHCQFKGPAGLCTIDQDITKSSQNFVALTWLSSLSTTRTKVAEQKHTFHLHTQWWQYSSEVRKQQWHVSPEVHEIVQMTTLSWSTWVTHLPKKSPVFVTFELPISHNLSFHKVVSSLCNQPYQ